MLNKFQLSICDSIVDNLIDSPLCTPFIHLVDPIADGAPDYNEIIKQPMALEVVKRKIQTKEYKTLDEFKNDVNLIWANTITYNGEDTIYSYMAKESKIWFNNMASKITESNETDWTRKLQSTISKLNKLLSNPPEECDPNGEIKKECMEQEKLEEQLENVEEEKKDNKKEDEKKEEKPKQEDPKPQPNSNENK
ncbi:Bromodomain containing protein [Trichomonas vaginalis G3]|uniref:Bromodomain containing protein n=1 Tax=Trichomonas vaginalis (strain ATCC PRA-98 / G3) TaxID=412133 RepID=A2EDB9_TRIV3|nr:acetylation-dependent protein binding [Trichomonas vaginalis G3]EAY09377.1 Bromodomain containing protein [Trichomonas vaginalis G3]KAI5501687.1 acetylation-dependent protein binding [Trichomonas vaginalis G3]|eukprot:XP_001321600.1 Bromodomain containing protein [Trichomonas vaginalis G3]